SDLFVSKKLENFRGKEKITLRGLIFARFPHEKMTISGDSGNVKVAVRVRPMNRREFDLGAKCILEINENRTTIYHPTSNNNEECFR
uniref:Kinesin motor domain-containing protein n=1 Tax=Romanomermis culicivorax TaxID=13658 RepID=A0A915IQH4_ROMCU